MGSPQELLPQPLPSQQMIIITSEMAVLEPPIIAPIMLAGFPPWSAYQIFIAFGVDPRAGQKSPFAWHAAVITKHSPCWGVHS